MKPPLPITRAFTATLLLAANLFAQKPPKSAPPTTLQAELHHLGAAAESQLDSLPNFTCHESATSQIVRNQKVRTDRQVQGTLRVMHQPNGTFEETYTYKRPRLLLIVPEPLPYFVRGGFASPLTYFLPAAQSCYSYALSPGRIDFATRSGPVPNHICRDQGLKGFALLNPAGEVTYIQRTIPNDVAKSLKLAPFAAIDLAPVTLDGRTYQLSQHLIATQPFGDSAGRFEAAYTDCRLFTATVTLGPATEVPTPQP